MAKQKETRKERLEAYLTELEAYLNQMRSYISNLDTGTTPPGSSPPKPPKLPR